MSSRALKQQLRALHETKKEISQHIKPKNRRVKQKLVQKALEQLEGDATKKERVKKSNLAYLTKSADSSAAALDLMSKVLAGKPRT